MKKLIILLLVLSSFGSFAQRKMSLQIGGEFYKFNRIYRYPSDEVNDRLYTFSPEIGLFYHLKDDKWAVGLLGAYAFEEDFGFGATDSNDGQVFFENHVFSSRISVQLRRRIVLIKPLAISPYVEAEYISYSFNGEKNYADVLSPTLGILAEYTLTKSFIVYAGFELENVFNVNYDAVVDVFPYCSPGDIASIYEVYYNKESLTVLKLQFGVAFTLKSKKDL